MATFNTKKETGPTTTNRAGGDAYEQSPKTRLASILFTSFLKEQYYRGADEQLAEIIEIVQNLPEKKFAAKAAIAARTQYHMRSTSHVVAAEIGRSVKGEQWTDDFFSSIVLRPDDMLEIVALYEQMEGLGLPAAMRRGFSRALRRMDEYELAKYQRSRHSWSLHDVVNLVRPEPTDAIDKMMNGELESPDTWEARKTKAGQSEDEGGSEESDEDVWADLLAEDKLGYFALLRNLRNIAQEAPDSLGVALGQLTDEDRILGSKVLPFRYMTAMDAIEDADIGRRAKQRIMDALGDALDISVQNVPVMDGNTAVLLDVSGSMRGRPMTIGALFAAILCKSNRATLVTFDREAETVTPNLSDTTTTIADQLRASGGGTDLQSAFFELDREFDRVIVLSDMQHWIGMGSGAEGLRAYRNRTGADPIVVSFDLQGYGDMQFPEDKVVEIAGFSDQVFDLLDAMEKGPEALIGEIEAIEL